MIMVLMPFVRLLGTVMLPDSTPEPLTVRDDVAATPPTVTPVVLLIVSLGYQPVPVTVDITVPAGPVFGVKVAVAVTVKAPVKPWAPLVAPVITMFLAPPAGVSPAGTVMLPASAPEVTDRVLVAVVPPTVTEEIDSLADQPVPIAVIAVPLGPIFGVKVIPGTTVKLVPEIWAPLMAPVITTLLEPGVRPEGTVMVPCSTPPLLTVREFAAARPPTLTDEMASLGTQPVPLVIVSVAPTAPVVGAKVDIAVVIVKAPVKVCALLLEPVITISLAPVDVLGTMIVPDSPPDVLTVRFCQAVTPLTVTGVIVSLAVQPVPLTVIVVPTGPVMGAKVAPGLIVKLLESVGPSNIELPDKVLTVTL